MDAALLLGDGDALYAVHARLVAQRPVRFGSTCGENGFLQTAECSFGERQNVDLPATTLAEARVHAKQIGGKQRRLVAAGARTDLDDGIAIVEGVAGGEQLGERRLQTVDLGTEPLDVGARELRQLGVLVGEDFTRLSQLALQPL